MAMPKSHIIIKTFPHFYQIKVSVRVHSIKIIAVPGKYLILTGRRDSFFFGYQKLLVGHF
jgi:hypothetical protein